MCSWKASITRMDFSQVNSLPDALVCTQFGQFFLETGTRKLGE